MTEEKTLKWVDKSDDGCDRWFLIYTETGRIIAAVEKFKYFGDNKWRASHHSLMEYFIDKESAMRHIEYIINSNERNYLGQATCGTGNCIRWTKDNND